MGEKKGEEEREVGKGPETVNAGQLHRDWQDNQGLVKQRKTKIPKKKQGYSRVMMVGVTTED